MDTRLSESLEKLNTLNEDINTSNMVVPLDVRTEGTTITKITPANTITLEIPDGVTCVRDVDWRLYSPTSGLYFTTLEEIIFPASIEDVGPLLFWTKPQYRITLRFKGSINTILSNIIETELNNSSGDREVAMRMEKLFQAKPAQQEECAKRLLCARMNIAYTNADFVFEVPLDISHLVPTTVQLQ